MQAGALGQFAAGAEFAFGTIVQRTMAEPGGARFHYGHPDVWNKLFTMTRGGVSKATRAFHISEVPRRRCRFMTALALCAS